MQIININILIHDMFIKTYVYSFIMEYYMIYNNYFHLAQKSSTNCSILYILEQRLISVKVDVNLLYDISKLNKNIGIFNVRFI